MKPIQILLVEDNAADVRLTQEAFKESRVPTHLNIAHDGVEAIAFLRRHEPFGTAVRPDLILLDLNLPRKDGRGVLADIKTDESLKRIPVVILTTSESEQDIVRTYDLHANCYITKPVDFSEFMRVIKSIEEFWLTIVKLPRGGANAA